jgi:hypothetical protein
MTTLGAVLIVRNEAAQIEHCLAAAIAAGVTVATIVDTGSTDDTRERAIDACGAIALRLHRRPFVNFGATRSAAFELARGSADWLLALDADMTVEVDPDFVPDPAVDAYMIRMGTSDFEYRLPLLLRGDLAWESRGAVHEYTALPDRDYVSRPTDAVRVSYPDGSSVDKSAWHLSLLEAADQSDPRTVFYTAQTLRDLGRNEEARAAYLRRVSMGGYAEEAFYAAYRAATLAPDWPTRAVELLAAWEMRPTRLEPLHALVSELNQRSQHHAAYRLTDGLPGPCADQLFVHRSIWDWGISFERSIAAWWVGDSAEFDALTDRLLANDRLPEHIRAAVEQNRGYRRTA